MKYGTLTRVLLEHLAESGEVLVNALIPRHPKARLARALLGLDHHRYPSHAAARHTFSTTLQRLKKQGLVASSGTQKTTRWNITKKGTKLLNKKPSLFSHIDHLLPQKDGVIRLVSFDIPEKQRNKRDWLRKELLACDYSFLHRSVFMGKRPLPDDLLHAIQDLALTKYIHIVSIGKAGTITKTF